MGTLMYPEDIVGWSEFVCQAGSTWRVRAVKRQFLADRAPLPLTAIRFG